MGNNRLIGAKKKYIDIGNHLYSGHCFIPALAITLTSFSGFMFYASNVIPVMATWWVTPRTRR